MNLQIDLEKLEAGKMEVDLRDLPLQVIITRSIEAVEQLFSSKSIRIKQQDTDLEVKGDGDRLIQVLVNLIFNAIKFSPENSELSISCSSQNEFVELRVCDQGPGIPEDKREQVFERFSQIENKSKTGTGLGLAICRLIIEMHNGKIGVDQAESGGASFWIHLPRAD